MSNKKVPKFSPKPGQIDYSKARWAPVVNSVIMHDGKILLVKRNSSLNFYPGYWNGISGFLDDSRSLEEKVRDEIREELGLGEKNIISIKLCGIFDQEEPKYVKTWIVHAVLVEVNTDKISTDWESEDHVWVSPEDIKNYELLPGFDKVLEKVLLAANKSLK